MLGSARAAHVPSRIRGVRSPGATHQPPCTDGSRSRPHRECIARSSLLYATSEPECRQEAFGDGPPSSRESKNALHQTAATNSRTRNFAQDLMDCPSLDSYEFPAIPSDERKSVLAQALS